MRSYGDQCIERAFGGAVETEARLDAAAAHVVVDRLRDADDRALDVVLRERLREVRRVRARVVAADDEEAVQREVGHRRRRRREMRFARELHSPAPEEVEPAHVHVR